jgi:Rrf2 family protein
MRVSARIDYAVRALVELSGSSRSAPRKLHDLAAAQQVPVAFLADILTMLRRAGLVSSQRGADGGYWLTRPAVEIRLAAVIAAVDGPFMEVPPARPGEVAPAGAAGLERVWEAMRQLAQLVTIAQVASGALPWPVLDLAARTAVPAADGDAATPNGLSAQARSPAPARDGRGAEPRA